MKTNELTPAQEAMIEEAITRCFGRIGDDLRMDYTAFTPVVRLAIHEFICLQNEAFSPPTENVSAPEPTLEDRVRCLEDHEGTHRELHFHLEERLNTISSPADYSPTLDGEEYVPTFQLTGFDTEGNPLYERRNTKLPVDAAKRAARAPCDEESGWKVIIPVLGKTEKQIEGDQH